MDIFINILKYSGIILLIFVIIIFILFLKNFIKTILVMNNVEEIILDFNKNNITEKYIWFEYYGETALGKIFNKGDDENPNLYVIAIFSKTNSIQQIPLEKIKKYLPLKLNTINSKQEETLNNNKNE